MVHPSSLGAFTETDAVRLFQSVPSLDSERQVFRGGSLLVMLRPARMLGLLSSPRRVPTGQPVYSRACSNEGLPPSKSAMTSRLNHLLPRQDLHLLACQRTKAALSPHFFNSIWPLISDIPLGMLHAPHERSLTTPQGASRAMRQEQCRPPNWELQAAQRL